MPILLEIKGDKFVTGIIYKDKKTGETKEIACLTEFSSKSAPIRPLIL